MKMIRHLLSDQKEYRAFLSDALIEEHMLEEMVQEGQHEDAALMRNLLQMILLGNADFIESHSRSKSESLFFNAVNLISAMFFSPFLLRFTPSSIPVAEYISGLKEQIAYSSEMKSEVLKQLGADVDQYHGFLDWLVANEQMTPDLASQLNYFHVVYDILGFQNAYHLTIQPKLTGLRVKGHGIRPDLLIWLPLKDKFRLIIECDGFAFHSDKETFTRDRQRDRALKAQGYDVFRFSGSEIYNDPANSAKELVEYLNGLNLSVNPEAA